jgi:phosphate-selective porin
VSAHGKLLNDRITYEAGGFRNDGDNARPSNSLRVFGGRTGVVRVTARPFRGAKTMASGLHVGAAVAFSSVPLGFPAVRARTVFGASFFDSDVWIQGRRSRTGLEARWSRGRTSVQSEYIRLTDERRGQSVENGDLSPLRAHGWYVSATYAVNEKRSRYGAVDLAARFETLSFGSRPRAGDASSSARADRVLGNTDRVVTCGASWQLNRWVKVQANLIREQLEDPSMGPLPARPVFWSRAFRVQLAI